MGKSRLKYFHIFWSFHNWVFQKLRNFIYFILNRFQSWGQRLFLFLAITKWNNQTSFFVSTPPSDHTSSNWTLWNALKWASKKKFTHKRLKKQVKPPPVSPARRSWRRMNYKNTLTECFMKIIINFVRFNLQANKLENSSTEIVRVGEMKRAF